MDETCRPGVCRKQPVKLNLAFQLEGIAERHISYASRQTGVGTRLEIRRARTEENEAGAVLLWGAFAQPSRQHVLCLFLLHPNTKKSVVVSKVTIKHRSSSRDQKLFSHK